MIERRKQEMLRIEQGRRLWALLRKKKTLANRVLDCGFECVGVLGGSQRETLWV